MSDFHRIGAHHSYLVYHLLLEHLDFDLFPTQFTEIQDLHTEVRICWEAVIISIGSDSDCITCLCHLPTTLNCCHEFDELFNLSPWA